MAKKNATPINCKNCTSLKKSVFCSLPIEEIEQLNLAKGYTTYKKGQYVFHQGTFPHGLFHIYSGKIKITKDGSDGKEQIVAMLKEGDILGYLSVISGEEYHVSSVAIEDSMVCFIPKKSFLELITRNASLSLSIIQLLAQVTENLQRSITDLAQKNVRERMAETLLFLIKNYGYEDKNQTLNVNLSREEIASMVGTSRETATRLLSEFNDEDTIKLSGKKIIILNEQKLKKTANASY